MVPAEFVTPILPVFAPLGTVVEICVSETTVKLAPLPLKVTRVAPVKCDPVMLTSVPRGPLVGENPLITGSAVTVKLAALLPVP